MAECIHLMERSTCAGQHEDTGANDHTHTEHRQLQRTQLLTQLMLGLLGVRNRLLDRLRGA